MTRSLRTTLTGRARDVVDAFLAEWGGERRDARHTSCVINDIFVEIQIAQATPTAAEEAGLPPAVVELGVGIDFGYTTGASFLERAEIHYDQTHLRALLNRQAITVPGVPDHIWCASTTDHVDAMADDMAAALEQQARPVIEVWTDPDEAYQRLFILETNHAPGAHGVAEMRYPGNPGSSTRLTALAVLAAMIGRHDLEVHHLLDHYRQSKHPWVEARLAELGQSPP